MMNHYQFWKQDSLHTDLHAKVNFNLLFLQSWFCLCVENFLENVQHVLFISTLFMGVPLFIVFLFSWMFL